MNEDEDSTSKIQILIEINFLEQNNNTNLKTGTQNSFDIDQTVILRMQNTYLLDSDSTLTLKPRKLRKIKTHGQEQLFHELET